MVDQPLVQEKLAHILQQLQLLQSKQGVAFEQFCDSTERQYLILHALQLAIQGCLDVASHIIADERLEVATAWKNLFEVLAKHRVLPGELVEPMASWAKLRNAIVHGYVSLDLRVAYEAWHNRLSEIERFCQAIKRYAKL